MIPLHNIKREKNSFIIPEELKTVIAGYFGRDSGRRGFARIYPSRSATLSNLPYLVVFVYPTSPTEDEIWQETYNSNRNNTRYPYRDDLVEIIYE